MTSTTQFLGYLKGRRFGPYTGVPCSFLKPFINFVIDDPELEYLPANNEGEAVALGVGAYLAGRKPVVMFQNSGLGNAVNPLTSLAYIFRVPMLLVCTWRGEPGIKDEPQHALMGPITPLLFDLMEIAHATFPESDGEIEPRLDAALRHMETTGLPYALVMRKDTMSPYELRGATTPVAARGGGCRLASEPAVGELLFRREALAEISSAVSPETVLVATTGKTARELFTYHDRAPNLYVVGAMGCATSVALGIAMNTRRLVVALDGDGAALMRLEAMVSVGHHAPANLVHLILDNQAYESTGSQGTLSAGVDFEGIALACGYRTAHSIRTVAGLREGMRLAISGGGPHLIRMRIKPGSDKNLGRPSLTPPEVARRLRATLLSDATAGETLSRHG